MPWSYLVFWKSHYYGAEEDSWGKSDVLQSMELQRVRHDWATEQQPLQVEDSSDVKEQLLEQK